MSHTEFSFNNVGKRLPYTVPDGYFEQMEDRIIAQVAKASQCAMQKSQRARRLRLAIITTAAAAIVVAFCLVPLARVSTTTIAPTTEELAQAFDALTPADQSLLLSLYEEDTFINDNISDTYDNEQTLSED